MDAALETAIRADLAVERERTEPLADAVEIPPIPVGRYVDDAFFELEQERLWPRTWVFAGHTSEWPENGSYRTFARTGAPLVIVRGMDGELRAFYNSCRHRGAPVVRGECGTSKRLTCQYHSWSYDTEGVLKAVPEARNFTGLDVNRVEDADLGLVAVRCEVSDGFVFVNEDPDARPLADFLGPLPAQMNEIDAPNLRKVGTQSYAVNCNWKVMVDAFLEVYHVRTVHPDNAALLYDDRQISLCMLPHGHSRLTTAKHDGMAELLAPPPHADSPSVGQLWRDTSTSFGVFPNLVVPMDTGAFTFLCMWPTGRSTTELELQWYAPDWGDDECPAEHTMKMTLFETVMNQDMANMSGIQASIESPGARPFRLGWHERLIHHFHRGVDLALGEDRLPAGTAVSSELDRFVQA
jgi:phenylpropionate dioxygenase-like ring-hydroxylating dioxygenase large terminal subunit